MKIVVCPKCENPNPRSLNDKWCCGECGVVFPKDLIDRFVTFHAELLEHKMKVCMEKILRE